MSGNRSLPHVKVLPEDDANRQLAIGFLQYPFLLARNIQVLRVARGWLNVLKLFESVHAIELDRHPDRLMVLLIDFDGDPDRLGQMKAKLPARFTDRVFVLGVLTEPERLKADLRRSYEAIGAAMARDCHEGTDTTWEHALLRHNAGELDRLRQHVRPILFPAVE
jgi:hypothetical protein